MATFWRATLNWKNTAINQFAQNCMHFEDPSDTRTAEQMAVLIDFNVWGETTGNEFLRNYTSGNVILQSITMQKLEPGPPQGGIPVVVRSAAGTQGTLVKHPALGFVFTLKDGLAGRMHRGRFYHYGAVSSHLQDGGPSSSILGPTGIPALIGKWQSTLMGAPTSGIHWCLFHRSLAGADRFTRVTSIQLSQICGVQRRRRIGIGM